MARKLWWCLGVVAMLCVVACGSGDPEDTIDAMSLTDTSESDDVGPGEDVAVAVDEGQVTSPTPFPSYSAGSCPTLGAGSQNFPSGGMTRSVHLTLPAEPEGAPVVFLFHGLGDQAVNIAAWMGASQAANLHGAIVVAPQGGQNFLGWDSGSQSASPPDLVFFDDLLACLAEQYKIDGYRIYAAGFSAGALWTTELVIRRSQYLAGAATFSGGIGQPVSYSTPEHDLPVAISWGGDTDVYGGFLSFQSTSLAFSESLREDGHFVIECNHGMGHTVPMGVSGWLYPFLLNHTWGVPDSPYTEGLDSTFPTFCVIP